MFKSKIPKKLMWVAGGLTFLICLIIFGLPYIMESKYELVNGSQATQASVTEASSSSLPVITHLPTPDPVKGIYITSCVAGTPSWRERLMNLVKNTELNSVVIDIKDYSGTVSFIDRSLQPNPGNGCEVKDMRAFIDELHRNNIYVIGRIAVFQDPLMTHLHPEWAVKSKSTGGIWKDHRGLSFIDVGAKPYWDWVVSLAKDSYNIGFDEINFDYIRYPSDGNLKDMDFTWMEASTTGSTPFDTRKAATVRSFFSYLHDHLEGTGMKTSADLFGLVTVAQDDLGIGQVLKNALPYFDYVDPMVYPSHFAKGTDGYENPAAHPYEIINFSMGEGLRREEALNAELGLSTSTPSKLRPWIQDFNLGAPYGVPEVRAQIKATYDVGLKSWLVWDAGNKYTPDAFLPKNSLTSAR